MCSPPLFAPPSGQARVRSSVYANAHADHGSSNISGTAKPSDPKSNSDAADSPKPAVAPKERVGRQKVILVADDDSVLRESLAAVLQAEDYKVQLAENGRMAVRRFFEGPPDLILLDLNMPDTDGWQAFQVISQVASYVPVIVITARPFQIRRAAEAGIDMLLEKPLDIPVLLETIRKVLSASEQTHLAKVLRAWRTKDLPDSVD